MNFFLKPSITNSSSLQEFFSGWTVGEGDLLITNRFILDSALQGGHCPCDVLYQEEYGSGEPNSDMVDAMLAAAESNNYQRVIAVGGGAVIDCAKLFVFGRGYNCDRILTEGPKLPHVRRLVVIPTTCGTGSEVTGVSVVEFKSKQAKINLRFPAIYSDEVVLIPALLNGLPFEVFANSSIDALIHAMESFVSPISNPFNRAMGRGAMELLLHGYQRLAEGARGVLPEPEDMEGFLYAATMAGIAFESGRCGPVHALSSPISFHFHFPHGKANYTVFEAVFRAYIKKGADLSRLMDALSDILRCPQKKAIDTLFALLESVYPNIKKGTLNVGHDLCCEMAMTVLETQSFLIHNGPVEFSQDEIAAIYKRCL